MASFLSATRFNIPKTAKDFIQKSYSVGNIEYTPPSSKDTATSSLTGSSSTSGIAEKQMMSLTPDDRSGPGSACSPQVASPYTGSVLSLEDKILKLSSKFANYKSNLMNNPEFFSTATAAAANSSSSGHQSARRKPQQQQQQQSGHSGGDVSPLSVGSARK